MKHTEIMLQADDKQITVSPILSKNAILPKWSKLTIQPKTNLLNSWNLAEREAKNARVGVFMNGAPELSYPRWQAPQKVAQSNRILLVDDFEPLRRFVVELLGKRPEFQVVGEASDGLEALQKAEEVRPDLILLDIGLPSLNGIEVARQMRRLIPESKIIFLTQESSSDVVQEAVSLGARGYVIKNMVRADLFAAVETVLAGMTFVSNCRFQLPA